MGEIETVLAKHQQVREAVVSVVQRGEEESRLVAYVVPDQRGGADVAADASRELASRWRLVWDETYLKTADGSGSFNIVGWNSSYSGEPISTAEMREWVDQTVDRVLAFKPKRVLEIGCGTGLILLRVAPQCRHYVGTDFSEVALGYLRGEIAKSPDEYRHVHLHQCAADALDGLGGPFDLIILNSVVQYFPSVDYLADVLRAAIRLSAPTGSILVGDVRSLPLMKAFHTAVELHHAPDTLTLDALQARIQKRSGQEKELAVDPAVFHEFGPEISQITVDLKRGTLINEVMQFRYDVTLRRQRARKAMAADHWLDWGASGFSLDKVRTTLATDQPKLLGISSIPNARLSAPLDALARLDDDQIETVGELRQRIGQLEHEAIDPEMLWAMGSDLGYGVSIGLRGSGADGRYDVVFRRGAPSQSFGFPSEKTRGNEGGRRVTNPVAGVVTQGLIANLRAYLQEQLPQYMVPASIVLLDELPQTPNGKIDRRALPALDAGRGGAVSTYLAPRSQTERRLAVIWADVLDIERMGVLDNFFELGGHSLLATQLISRIRIEFNNELPVRAVFEAPTIADLAAKLDQWAGQGGRTSEQAIGRLSRRPPGAREAIVTVNGSNDSGPSIVDH